jgi:hypothetical protein
MEKIPDLAKLMLSCSATLLVEYAMLNFMSMNMYLVMALVAILGSVFWWKKEKMYAFGVFAALLVSAGILAFAIWSFATRTH